MAGENDLVEIRCETEPATQPAGVQFWAKRTNQNIAAYDGTSKSGPWYSTTTNEINITSSPKTGWVEWRSMDPLQTGANFELYVWDATHQRRFDAPDVLHFYPFTSIVIVLGGENQVPADPVSDPGNHGIFELAIRQYRSGYDVHMYDEDNVDAWNGRGVVYDEIVNGIQNRGITGTAILGYSHGGGATYQLAFRLNRNTISGDLTDITLPFNVGFTAYVDAVTASTAGAENRRPPLSLFHLNQWEKTPILFMADPQAATMTST